MTSADQLSGFKGVSPFPRRFSWRFIVLIRFRTRAREASQLANQSLANPAYASQVEGGHPAAAAGVLEPEF